MIKRRPKLMVLIFSIVLTVLLTCVIIFLANGRYQNKRLFDAIKNDDYALAKEAIDSGAFINTRRYWGEPLPTLVDTNPTPIIEACKLYRADIIELLVEEGADLNKKDNCTQSTALERVLSGRNVERFKTAAFLIEHGADIRKCDTKRLFTKVLIQYSEDSDKTASEGFEFLKVMLKEYDLEPIVQGNMSALTHAAKYGNCNAVKYFIEQGYFDVNSLDKMGNTALIVAVNNEKIAVIEQLIELSADPNVKDSTGKTAYNYALENGNQTIIQLLNS